MYKPRILIVDDEPGFVRLLKLLLENTGRYAVREEIDATKAVAAARQFKPDLVLLDFVMPKIDGGSLAQGLKADPQFRHTSVLFLSATVTGKADSTVEIAGFPAYAKPIGLNRLMEVIDENLASRKKRDGSGNRKSFFASMARRLRGFNGAGGPS